jgi:hypothetical protein
MNYLLTIASSFLLLLCFSCAKLTIKNSSGATMSVVFDTESPTNVNNDASIEKTVPTKLFEPDQTVVVKASGIFVSATSNIKPAQQSSITVPFSANLGNVKVVNTSGRTITNVMITLSTSTTWGANLLSGSSISSGSEANFPMSTAGQYDILIMDGTYYGAVFKFSVSIGSTTTKSWGTSTISAPLNSFSSVK